MAANCYCKKYPNTYVIDNALYISINMPVHGFFLLSHVSYLAVNTATHEVRKSLELGVSGLQKQHSISGSSEELIDLATKDLVCLSLAEVSDDSVLAFYPFASGSQR